MDSDDEEFIARAIEDKSTAHGRRHDMVLYTGMHRVKKSDLLSLANYRRLQKGKQLIKSATTVYNRSRPCNKRSLQAKRHKGSGLFCFKKPPKTESVGTELTHHQRKHVQLAKQHLWNASVPTVSHITENNMESQSVAPAGEDGGDFTAASGSACNSKICGVEISDDDKAYVRPGTGTGMSGTKSQKVSQTTNQSGIHPRELPVHDFYEPKYCQTPAAQRYMTRKVEVVEGRMKLILLDDETVFTVRPKAYVGSSASVWASDHMMVHSNPFARNSWKWRC